MPIMLCVALRPCATKGYSFQPNGHTYNIQEQNQSLYHSKCDTK